MLRFLLNAICSGARGLRDGLGWWSLVWCRDPRVGCPGRGLFRGSAFSFWPFGTGESAEANSPAALTWHRPPGVVGKRESWFCWRWCWRSPCHLRLAARDESSAFRSESSTQAALIALAPMACKVVPSGTRRRRRALSGSAATGQSLIRKAQKAIQPGARRKGSISANPPTSKGRAVARHGLERCCVPLADQRPLVKLGVARKGGALIERAQREQKSGP